MEARHDRQGSEWIPDALLDGGDLDCGSGLLLLIRRHIDPLPRGSVLELRSRESTVATDLPAWCRMTGNELLAVRDDGSYQAYLICKGSPTERRTMAPLAAASTGSRHLASLAGGEAGLASPTRVGPVTSVPPIPPLAVMGIGSWPRPRWMQAAIHAHVSGEMDEATFQDTADDAVRLCVAAQERAGVDVLTDGEQRRDSYASFVGGILDHCQLIPITDLLPYVEDPDEFARELRALDVPAHEVRHPAVWGKLNRSRPLTVHEFAFVRRLSDKPIKVALPGPYLLTRTMWLECVSDRAYAAQEQLAEDIVRILREEVHDLLAAGVALVQLDEPVLSEVVYGESRQRRSFMCGALSGKRPQHRELEFAADLLRGVLQGMPRDRIGLHVCRGNWSRNEEVALRGDYGPLIGTLSAIPVGTYFLELCTPRAGEWDVLRQLPDDARIGVGVVNPKSDCVETVDEIRLAVERAIRLFGYDRVLLNPDCGFATFADNPVSRAETAEAKLAAMHEAAVRCRREFRG